MGSGISLSDEQLTQIVKRDLKIEYNTLVATRKPCATAWETYRNYLDEAKFNAINKRVDIVYQERKKRLFT